MALRYSGSLKIAVAFDDRRNAYRASVSHKGRSLWSGYVGVPASSRGAVDSPIAYDGAAHAALSFASSDGVEVDRFADYDDRMAGWVISRSAARANPSPARRRPAAKRRTAKRATRRTAKRTSKRPSAKRRTARARTRR